MRLVSWNVNGLRAAVKKGFEDSVLDLDADAICLQETKLQEGQIDLDLPGYLQFWSYAEKKGYSGTAIFTRREPLRALHGLECLNLIPRDASSRWNSPSFGSLMCIRRTRKMVWLV